jgi:hypothetical protein
MSESESSEGEPTPDEYGYCQLSMDAEGDDDDEDSDVLEPETERSDGGGTLDDDARIADLALRSLDAEYERVCAEPDLNAIVAQESVSVAPAQAPSEPSLVKEDGQQMSAKVAGGHDDDDGADNQLPDHDPELPPKVKALPVKADDALDLSKGTIHIEQQCGHSFLHSFVYSMC